MRTGRWPLHSAIWSHHPSSSSSLPGDGRIAVATLSGPWGLPRHEGHVASCGLASGEPFHLPPGRYLLYEDRTLPHLQTMYSDEHIRLAPDSRWQHLAESGERPCCVVRHRVTPITLARLGSRRRTCLWTALHQTRLKASPCHRECHAHGRRSSTTTASPYPNIPVRPGPLRRQRAIPFPMEREEVGP